MLTPKTTKEIAFDQIVHTLRALEFGDGEIMDLNIGSMALDVQNARLKNAANSSDPTFLDIQGKAAQNLKWFMMYDGTLKEWGAACVEEPRLFVTNPGSLKKNFESNLGWLEEYDVGYEVWKNACLRDPRLFLTEPEKVRTLFKTNVDHFADYGVTGERWAAFCEMNPVRFMEKPENFQKILELAMVLSKTPHHISTEPQGSFEQKRVDWFLKRNRRSEISPEGFLLRLAYLEIVKPAPTVALMTKNTGFFQQKVVEALTVSSAEATSQVCENTDQKQPTAKEMKRTLVSYVAKICGDVRAKWGDGKAAMPQPALVSVLAPENAGLETPKEKVLLLNRMVLAGLVRH